MNVYLVEKVIEHEYGGREVVKVFSHESDAKDYIKENDTVWHPWWDKHRDYSTLSYKKMEIS